VPPSWFAVGVKMAVRVRPVPLIADSVPPLTVTSPLPPLQVKVPLGSSLKVMVTVAVWPAFRGAVASLAMETVGGVVSTVTVVALDALLALFAPSVAVTVIACPPSASGAVGML